MDSRPLLKLAEQPNYQLWHGPMQELCPMLEDHSFDAIITDPPYERKYWPLYQYILDQADRLLRPGGYLLMIVPHIMLDPSTQALTISEDSTMRFRWPLLMNQLHGSHARLCNAKRNVRVTYKMIGWWIKEPADRDYSEVVDQFENDPPKKGFRWEQSTSWARYCLGMLKEGSRVLEPMAGHGVLPVEAVLSGHRVVACELDEERAGETARRLKEAYAEWSSELIAGDEQLLDALRQGEDDAANGRFVELNDVFGDDDTP